MEHWYMGSGFRKKVQMPENAQRIYSLFLCSASEVLHMAAHAQILSASKEKCQALSKIPYLHDQFEN
eukprot:1095188-Pelagomonas_calceolata.AAC.1